MYKINYLSDDESVNILDRIESLEIDMMDIAEMRFVFVSITESENNANLGIFHARCEAQFNGDIPVVGTLKLMNDSKQNRDFIQSIIHADWLIDKDDFTKNKEGLISRRKKMKEELQRKSTSRYLKDIHRCNLIKGFLREIEYVERRTYPSNQEDAFVNENHYSEKTI